MTIGAYNPMIGQRLKAHAVEAVERAFVARYAVPGAAAIVADADGVLVSTVLLDGATKTVTPVGGVELDAPRVLTIKGNAAGIAGNVVITGKDAAGDTITDTIAANGANSVEGAKAFSEVTGIVLPARTQEADEISVGFSNRLGLPYKLPANTVLFAVFNGTREAVDPTVATDAAALSGNTILLNSALNGSDVEIYFIV